MADTSGDPCAIRKSTRCSCARLNGAYKIKAARFN